MDQNPPLRNDRNATFVEGNFLVCDTKCVEKQHLCFVSKDSVVVLQRKRSETEGNSSEFPLWARADPISRLGQSRLICTRPRLALSTNGLTTAASVRGEQNCFGGMLGSGNFVCFKFGESFCWTTGTKGVDAFILWTLQTSGNDRSDQIDTHIAEFSECWDR